MPNPLVSIIVPTKNSEKFLEQCLASVKAQTYENLEIIVVDNNSTDRTKEIAQEFSKRFTQLNVKLFNRGPERSAQRNFGVENATGEFVAIIDSDMELSEKVIASCVEKMQSSRDVVGIIIPEESIGEGFWAQCKRLERSFYVGVEWMEAARFFQKDVYQKVGGYNETMVSGEDWDLSQRIEALGRIDRISDFICHNEGTISLWKTIKKKFYYAGKFSAYTKENQNKGKIAKQTGIINRYKLFFSQPKKLFKNPIIGLGMLFMKTCEFGFGGVGYLVGMLVVKNKSIKILLLGTHGQNNIGDELLLEAFLFQLRKINSAKVNFYVNSYLPQTTAKNFNVETFHTIKEKHKLLKYIFRSDYIIFAGGSIIKEMYSAYGRNTYSVMNMLILLIIFAKKIARKKIILSNIGIGPINSKKGFHKAGLILRNSDIVSVRDNISKIYGEKAYSLVPIKVVPDAVLSLNADYFNLPQLKEEENQEIKKINTIALNFCRNISKPEAWDHFMSEMLQVFNNLYIINPAIKIVGLPMQLDYSTDDYNVLKAFKDKLVSVNPEINFQIARPRSSKEVANIINNSDLLITERLHCAILATIINTPFLSLEYDIKVQGYLETIGLGENGIDISENFQSADVLKRISIISQSYQQQKKYLKTVFIKNNVIANKYFEELRIDILKQI
ncbi:MAG: glycosyltransferase [Parcubacteria group bacterium]|jgi:glycosyltransferase involved in cell wall biosynthesis